MKNLRQISRELGENLTDEELQAMIDEFDKDQDGLSILYKVNEQEFINIIKAGSLY